jgi:hypothetical protein
MAVAGRRWLPVGVRPGDFPTPTRAAWPSSTPIVTVSEGLAGEAPGTWTGKEGGHGASTAGDSFVCPEASSG